MQMYRRLLLSSSLMGLAIAGLPSPATTVSPPPVVRPPAWAERDPSPPQDPQDPPSHPSGRVKYALDRAEAKRRRRAAQRRAEYA